MKHTSILLLLVGGFAIGCEKPSPAKDTPSDAKASQSALPESSLAENLPLPDGAIQWTSVSSHLRFPSKLAILPDIVDAPFDGVRKGYLEQNGAYDLREVVYYARWASRVEEEIIRVRKTETRMEPPPHPHYVHQSYASVLAMRRGSVDFPHAEVRGICLNAPSKDFRDLEHLTGLQALLIWCGTANLGHIEAETWAGDKNCLHEVLRLKAVRNVIALQLPAGPATTDATLKGIADYKKLRALSLWNIAVTDQGLAELISLDQLVVLNLDGTKVSDEGMKYVGKLKNLRSLSLNNTAVSSAGLAKLRDLQHLSEVRAYYSDITAEELSEFAGNVPSMRYGVSQYLKEGVAEYHAGKPPAR